MSSAGAAQCDGAVPLILRISGAENDSVRPVVMLAKWDGILGVGHRPIVSSFSLLQIIS
jgi:hypothetical protein